MERTSTVFDRLRKLETQGQPLHALIVETCDVGDELIAALRQAREHFTEIRMDWSDPRDEIRAGWAVIDAALARAYADNGHTPDNGKAAA
jgi:hypothetical protein